jgi:hypothetical protein
LTLLLLLLLLLDAAPSPAHSAHHAIPHATNAAVQDSLFPLRR